MRLIVGGVHLRGDGYPNAWHTLGIVRDTLRVPVVERGYWLPPDMHLWKLVKGPKVKALRGLALLLAGNLLSALRVLASYRRGDRVYVPYPGIFFLWFLSWLPRRIRPRCLCDTFISLWDTLYQDRARGHQHSLASRLLRRFEARALRAADQVLVDTTANKDYLCELYQLAPERVHAVPLAIDESLFNHPKADRNTTERLNVLFVGTFVPLHGVDALLEGITPLLNDPRFHFTFIGDGQSADRFAELLQQRGQQDHFQWLRAWTPLDVIAAHIAAADICLGVFGGSGKAARVLPYKLYMYLAAGKAVVSQRHYSLPDLAHALPINGCEPDSTSIRDALLALADDAPRRQQMAGNARQYYTDWLSHERIATQWRTLLEPPAGTP